MVSVTTSLNSHSRSIPARISLLFAIPVLVVLAVTAVPAEDPGDDSLSGSSGTQGTVEAMRRTAQATPIEGGSDTSEPFGDPFAATGGSDVSISDPLESVNRTIFWVNKKSYFNVLEPIGQGYRDVLPRTARTKVRNFFSNLDEPKNFFSSLLRLDVKDAGVALSRLTINTTVGVGGLFDPASSFLRKETSGFDRTLAYWDVETGFYVTWPLVGPSTVRGSFGSLFNALTYPPNFLTGPDAELAVLSIGATRAVNETSFTLGRYDQLRDATVDAYAARKNLYEQSLEQRLKDR